ncbi:MAG: hypothetical protein CFH22_00691 [Alphaproteobacteria bacterium MarineAlpha5_Bin12]|nr:MAG: hypothetical protein CFH22_00691 [Alphaproteobacteria bacterium MarineAlpha5_Bin12]|tara:strand:- start:3134 stop:3931 length:798 start_codon:yes stop_codon:yes gene_type:complete
MKIKIASCFYYGNVYHKRFQPFINQFKYRVFSLYLDYDELSLLSKKFYFFSYNKFNLLSFFDKDHGSRNGQNLKKFIIKELKKNNISEINLKIKILCFPRILGYVFNPLSVIFCFKKNVLVSIFYEVKNTSNEQHTYIFINHKKIKKNIYKHKCNKKFYVSPFMKIEGFYEFLISEPKKTLSVNIKQYLNDKSLILIASQYGKKTYISNKSIIITFFSYPLLTIKVIYSIHWQAFKIWLKGGMFKSRDPKIKDTKSLEGDIIGKF